MRSIVDLAGNLGLRTVTEGLERPEQAEVQLASGCEVGQGFGSARPMALDDLLAWAARRRRPPVGAPPAPG